MKVVRPATMDDLAAIKKMAASSSGGIVSLVNDTERLLQKLELSRLSFSIEPLRPNGELYFFVMEESETHEVVGCCATLSKTGGYIPQVVFRIEQDVAAGPHLSYDRPISALHIHEIYDGPAELCTLFLFRDHRASGLGKLLSLSRLLFLGLHERRFDPMIQAHLRGVHDDKGASHFWLSIMSHFFTPFNADRVYTLRAEDPALFHALMPHYPIYINLLQESVQDVIGKTHPHTVPAEQLLAEEGMSFASQVDLFDAGPYVAAPIKSLRIVRERASASCSPLVQGAATGPRGLISNHGLAGFRAALAPLIFDDNGAILLKEEVMRALLIERGDPVSYVSIERRSGG